jgi:hypothetical protein
MIIKLLIVLEVPKKETYNKIMKILKIMISIQLLNRL